MRFRFRNDTRLTDLALTGAPVPAVPTPNQAHLSKFIWWLLSWLGWLGLAGLAGLAGPGWAGWAWLGWLGLGWLGWVWLEKNLPNSVKF